MGTQLTDAIAMIVDVFHYYSGKEGDKYKLNKNELKTLITEQLPDYLKNNHNPKEVERVLSDLDFNGDNEVDFNEFLSVVCCMIMACNKFFIDYPLIPGDEQEEQKKE